MLPAPAGPAPYRLRLADVLPVARLRQIERDGTLRFHCVGDTGGYHNPVPQRAVAEAMATELDGERPVSFFYHLGDVVYPHGERAHYDPQFFEAYDRYAAPILGVAGNHDGEAVAGSENSSLEGFVTQFCSPREPIGLHNPASGTSPREGVRAPQHQPNVYWTLEAEWVTIIGLYSGVPEGGEFGDDQLDWLTGELAEARRGVVLILAMHHPVFSADRVHGSNLVLGDVLDDCFAVAGRVPDAVFSAHAHNYQRFTRLHGRRAIPYVVAGSGGFPELHGLGFGVPEVPASFAALPDLTLEAHQHEAFGFMTVTCGPRRATVDYNVVVRRRPVPYDSFSVMPAAAV
jgi:hypothetical protein